ncbi:MAG: hypothetical protein PHG35_03325 [Dehalococcoidales bacterium]|jgi:hypothetical protein|nr:hypothetical protein [Dehalococcoidales bacterium]
MLKKSVTEFKKMDAKALKNSPGLELTVDGETVAFVVVGAEGAMAERIRGCASQVDAARGK